LELEDQRKAIKTKNKEIEDDIRIKKMLAQKEADAKKAGK
jgi:hypothetical protein